ncbi:hypothetical protein BB560_000711 [Smittium megazygosporum]|uniref:UTP--glucose-1-phosphate uridylyltransferase n=1 Tax=Smittium megazygosporum TaxID=133381 RepID=A0A2T9ZJN1_9FUNG|nr:hypothetical protein BB560_000711 [Smittium megazygosporum]
MTSPVHKSGYITYGKSEYVENIEDSGDTLAAINKSLKKITSQVPDDKQFKTEMDDFYSQVSRYIKEKVKSKELDWEKVKSPKPEYVIPYNQINPAKKDEVSSLLNKLAVIKLNGGLGTTMGCVGPKSAIEVRNGLTFLDLTVQQIEHLNSTYNANVPLILMNSFNTDEDTQKILKKYYNHDINIYTFNQSRWPRINADSLLPIASSAKPTAGAWYPPGHGDIYSSLYNSGLLQKLLDLGKEYVFVSNIDNLGATVDTKILSHVFDSQTDFVLEVTDKTKADIKGGTIIDYDGSIRLLEIAQVPKLYVDDFKRVKKFKIFNTNNIWIRLDAIKSLVEQKKLDLDLIVNRKTTDSGERVIQLETAIGAAMKHFEKAHGVNVPRSRFLPVKSTSDLFIVTSDLYILKDGVLTMNPLRTFGNVPIVKLGDHFKKVKDFQARFKSPPQILELDHLSVTGDVYFGAHVTLTGTVIIVANHGAHIDIPRGAVLNDKVVSGDLRIMDH